jgi:hypothetical protein
MPIFKRFKIDRYKEVMINQSTGLAQDGGLSTYTFDNENNRDFVGIVKDIRLIGDVIEITMDTGRFSVNQINNTTQTEFNQLVSNGTIRITERSLGWVEIAKTRASFYYEECSPTSFVRKKPVSEHYYDFSTFTFGTSLVAGSGPQDTDIQNSVGEDALRPVGTFDPNIGNNMGVFGPGFNQLDLQSYMRMVINSTISTGNGFIQNTRGETRPVNSWSPLDGEILRQIPLYLANTNEHFDNPNSQTISSGRYGRGRATIQEGFSASSYIGVDFSKSTGQCLETTIKWDDTIVQKDGGLTTSKKFYINDMVLTTEYGNDKIQAVNENILYKKDGFFGRNKNESIIKSSYTLDSLSGINPFDKKFDPSQPPLDFRLGDAQTRKPGTNYIIDSVITPSYNIVAINPFLRNSKDALTFDFSYKKITIIAHPDKLDTEIYDTKLNISNQKINVTDYINKLIFIKNEIKGSQNKITG